MLKNEEIQCVILAGGKPVWVDGDIDSMNMNKEILEEAYTEDMKVFCPVSWAGVPLEKEIYDFLIEKFNI
mgnify:CR=1 FL=1